MTTADLPDCDALDALVDEDPIALRDVAWKLRTRVAEAEAALERATWDHGTTQARLDELLRSANIWRAWWDGKGGPQCTNLARKVDRMTVLEREPAGTGEGVARVAAYERLEMAARALADDLDSRMQGDPMPDDEALRAALRALPAPEVTP